MKDILGPIAPTVPNLIAALCILILGWLLAFAIAALMRGALRKTKLNQRLAGWLGKEDEKEAPTVEQWVGKGVFYIIIFLVLVAFFQALGLTLITEPLNRLLNQIFAYAPRLLAPAILLLVAWILASILRFTLAKVLTAFKFDERLSTQAGIEEEDKAIPLSRSISDAIYWLTFLLFLPAILDALALEGLMVPVQGMVDQVLTFLPNLFAAFLILVAGWFLARIVQHIVANLLMSVGADQLSRRVGLTALLGKQRLSGLIGLLVYILILIPVLIAALNALALEAITRPASEMLNIILSAIPAIFAAFFLLGIAYVIGRVVAQLISKFLAGIGFDHIFTHLGLSVQPAEGKQTPSEIVGMLVVVAIMFFAFIEAFDLLGFEELAGLVTDFTLLAGHILLGIVIFGIGLYLANLTSRTIRSSGSSQADLLAVGARTTVAVIAGAMALRQMGIANEIITLGFGLLLGAVAVALAIAFGMGGRDLASRCLEDWLQKKDKNKT